MSKARDLSHLNELTDLDGISDGTNGQVLTTDGSGTFTFEDSSGGVTSVDGNTGAVTTLQLGTTSTTALAGDTSLFSGAYADLTGKPTIPTNNNQLTNGASYITDYTVTSGDVTAHEGNLTITESQISDLGSYITGYTVTESDVTAHQAALSITESQISDLGSYITGYTVTESDVTAHEAALDIATSQLTGDIDLATQVTGTLPVSNMAATALTTVQTAASESAQLALTAQEGDVVVRSDENKTYMHNGGVAGTMADFTLLATPTDSVTSVDGNTGAVTTLQLGTTSTTALAGNTSLFSGSYADLTNKPTLLTLGTTSTTALAGDTTIPSALTDLSISDGTNGQVLTTDGSGSFTFEDAASPYGDTEVSAHLNTSTANSDEVLSWNGSDFEWVEKGATFNTFTYVATSNQTTFSGSDSNSQTLAYSAGKVIVALNGTILKETTDYTATNGTSVVLATGAEASHELTIIAFGAFDVANVDYADVNNTPTLPTDFVSAASGGTFSGNVAINGDLTVDNVTSNSSPVATLSSLSTFNGVGSYCLAHHTSSNSSLTANTSVSGSSLRAVGFYHLISDSSSSAYYPDEDGSALSGTWRVMGEARDNGSPTTLRPATLFVRIS